MVLVILLSFSNCENHFEVEQYRFFSRKYLANNTGFWGANIIKTCHLFYQIKREKTQVTFEIHL